jgi:hypothetical protein
MITYEDLLKFKNIKQISCISDIGCLNEKDGSFRFLNYLIITPEKTIVNIPNETSYISKTLSFLNLFIPAKYIIQHEYNTNKLYIGFEKDPIPLSATLEFDKNGNLLNKSNLPDKKVIEELDKEIKRNNRKLRKEIISRIRLIGVDTLNATYQKNPVSKQHTSSTYESLSKLNRGEYSVNNILVGLNHYTRSKRWGNPVTKFQWGKDALLLNPDEIADRLLKAINLHKSEIIQWQYEHERNKN